ncbi:isochorismatase family protein [Paenibacillus thalictri]|uniref:Isochorismatase family protein n=1 Tax=Paenibacillus thalictri TaxID=2527873 RepID=A0A4Q9DYL4_9BACL|nr:isochorismatase family protein [Paenibacillus thalictri]TBL81515.1 isochorismatase family protein [Paenibacillus thalictri]
MDAFEDHCWEDVVDQEVLDIYKAYRRETYIGRKPALLVIDLYNLAFQGGAKLPIELQDTFPSSCGKYAWEAVEPTRRLLARCRELDIPVVYSTADTRMRKKSSISATNRKGAAPTEDAFEIFEAYHPEPQDLIIYKSRASAFYGTTLAAQLTMMGIDSLIVVGESTSGCVRASAVDGYSYGFHVSLVEECCFDRSPLSHKISLFDLHHKYADVMHIEEALDHLAVKET